MGPDYSTAAPAAAQSTRAFQGRARAVAVLLAAALGAGATARLGVWQLSRAQQKEALQQTLQARAALPVLAQTQLSQTAVGAALQHYQRVRLVGEWLPQATVFLENRQMNGRPGFFAITPLRLASGEAVLVQRGWAPRDLGDRTRVPALPTPVGPVAVLGQVVPPPSKLFDFAGPAQEGAVRQNIDLQAFALELGVALRPLSVLQLDEVLPSAPVADGLLRSWPAPAANVAKHHGYAFQWFALCALITGLYVWFQLLRPRISRRAPDER